ncbi:hypothetical protein [Streptomyces phaeolivaceus]|uniref:hypothetical protein n=1 Tax=Streptomyces phaeolivaceus TaxID=2653200 RepID=UPI001D046288|nr:hypothetical protein [Streptomyces phaeolivaceus]
MTYAPSPSGFSSAAPVSTNAVAACSSSGCVGWSSWVVKPTMKLAERCGKAVAAGATVLAAPPTDMRCGKRRWPGRRSASHAVTIRFSSVGENGLSKNR